MSVKPAITKEFLKGMRWTDIVKLDPDVISRFDKGAMKTAVSRLAKNANRRIGEFRARGMESPATRWVKKSGGDFSAKGKSFNQLRSEFRRASDYLTAQTSTVKGYNNLKGEIYYKLEKYDVEVTTRDYEKFWRAYERLKETNPAVKDKSLKYKVLSHISKMIQTDRRWGAKTIASNISGRIDEIEKEANDNARDDPGVSQYFSPPV